MRPRPGMVLLAGLLAVTTACGRPDEHAAEHEAEYAAEPGTHAARPAPDPADTPVVRLAPDMLRDLRLTTVLAELRPAGDAVNLLGELRVNEDAYAEIGTAIAARVLRVLAGFGDGVTAGQALVELESPDVGRARAAVETAKARLELARRTVERRRPLAGLGIVPRRELQAAEAELVAARAEHGAAQQALASLGAHHGDGARFRLVAPIAGTVIDRTALPGRLVDSERPLFVVADLRRLWLVVHASERDAVRVRPGTAARATFPALPGETFSGTVLRVGSRVDPASRTIDVRIEVDNPAGVLRPGMSGAALVPLGSGEESVVAVPAAAVQRVGESWSVFLPRDETTFEIRPVGRGRDLGGAVEILSGLRAGETVVVEGAFLLRAEHEKARHAGEAHDH